MDMIKNKRGLSVVIGTVLLILVVVASIVIIAPVIINFVKEKTQESKECFDMLGALTIDLEGYYCYDSDDNNKIKLTIHRENVDIKGIKISISGGGNSKVFEIEDNTQIEGIKMLNGSEILYLPQKGGEKTYVMNSRLNEIQKAIIVPITPSGKICKETDEITLQECG